NIEDIQYGYYSGIRTASYKYGEQVNNKETYTGNEFYDLSADAYAVDSRPDDPNYTQVVDQLKAMLAGLRSCKGRDCWVDTAMPATVRRLPVKPQIGRICRACANPNVNLPLEPSESSSIH